MNLLFHLYNKLKTGFECKGFHKALHEEKHAEEHNNQNEKNLEYWQDGLIM